MTDERKKERFPVNGLGDEGEDKDESGCAVVTSVEKEIRKRRLPEYAGASGDENGG